MDLFQGLTPGRINWIFAIIVIGPATCFYFKIAQDFKYD